MLVFVIIEEFLRVLFSIHKPLTTKTKFSKNKNFSKINKFFNERHLKRFGKLNAI
jgi:uracil DNA glycosylase